jgi:signal transduction histidine kinase/CheY-like chemotaxis protein
MTTDEITASIASRMGDVPPFFRAAEDSPALLGQLWRQALSADLDNPLPALFKEQLAAYLARYCTAPYSIVCHSCSLAALGVPPAAIFALLEMPVPAEDEIERALDLLAAEPVPLAGFPAAGSELATAVQRIAVHFFLNRDRAARCRAALRRLLGDVDYNYLMVFLAYVKASHVWVEAHPELSYELDPRAQAHLPRLLAEEPRLGELFRLYRDRARREYRRLEERLVADVDRHRHGEKQLKERIEQLQMLYELNDAVGRAEAVEEIYRVALDGLVRSLGTDRASILLFDADGVIRFKAWRGLSEEYRRAVEGHSPWTRDTLDPRPIVVGDVLKDPDLAAILPVLTRERIRAAAFIPLTHQRRLIGKFMLYYESPRELAEAEVHLAQNVAGHVAFAIARRQAEEERTRLLERERAARAEAEAASRAKDDFLATISHELRTPLTAILAWPLILRGKLGDPEALTRGLGVIERNAQLQAQIIEDLLEVSRIVTGKLRLDLRPLELTPILAAAADTLRGAAEAKGVGLMTRIEEPVGPVHGDPDRLQQILWNLLSNAVKFTGPGGRVEMSLERTATHAVIRVRDDGQGIAPEFLPYVFDRFRQADSSTTRRHGGLGLGLAIVRHLVELHGGTVAADSPGTGRGATFTVELPLSFPVLAGAGRLQAPRAIGAAGRSESAELAAMAEVAEVADLSGLSLVVVDDEPDTLEMLTEALSGHGAEVRPCRSAAEALAALAERPADALLSDIAMPGVDGYELIRRVRALSGIEGIPAIALTAYARAEDRERSLQAGFQVHVAKPVEPARLAVIVAQLVR